MQSWQNAMTFYVYNSTTIDGLDNNIGLFNGDIVLVGAQALYVKTFNSVFRILDTNALSISFVINGTIGSQFSVIGAGTFAPNVDIHVGVTGVLFGGEPISFNSVNPHIFNEGLIFATSIAFHLGGTAGSGHDISIINYGTIVGGAYSIALFEGTLERTVLDNHGRIGESIASVAFGSSDTTLTNDIIRNSGDIYGDVYMGGGNDLFDARGGTVLGTIFLGPGDDRYVAGLAEETVVGGAGISKDIIDFRSSAGVTFSLDGTLEATGVAFGDVYSGFAYIFGSVSAADNLRGDGQANRITGGGGADDLDGAAGNDSLIGGKGGDTLTGGLGDDRFIYNRAAESPDTILDFSNVAGNNDAFQFVKATFDTTLTLGTLAAAKFQTRADNLAQDSDDRFIFRTTDQTLWFDADGIGALGPIMIADLQATATVTALDILIV